MNVLDRRGFDAEPSRLRRTPFRSWLMAGFESAAMAFGDRRVDGIRQTAHDVHAREDYALVRHHGMLSARDALRWHLIERMPRQYDWSSFLPMLRAARDADVQIVWDLCHFGFPDDVDPWSAAFEDRFLSFVRAAAQVVAAETEEAPVWCPVNEISFWAYAGGEHAHFAPFGRLRGHEWKRQLARLAIGATRELRAVDPRARIIHTDPVIHVTSPEPETDDLAEAERLSMFQAWDMICGRAEPDLGGRPDDLDLVGANFYPSNQWTVAKVRVGFGELKYRPFCEILLELGSRYGRPIVITETGAEEPNGAAWLRYVAEETLDALEAGADIAGLCLYPVMDYVGWSNERHCRCGLIELSPDFAERRVRPKIARMLERYDSQLPVRDHHSQEV